MPSTHEKKCKGGAQRPHALDTKHRHTPTPPHASLLSLAMLAAFVSWSAPARAADECGAAAGVPPTVNCTNAGLNPYFSGITYSTATGLTIDVTNIDVVRNNGGVVPNRDGLRLTGSGAGLLQLSFHNGASISTDGDQSDGISVTSTGQSALLIEAQGEIAIATPAVVAGAVPTAAVSGVQTSAADSGFISIQHASTSQITGTGAGAGAVGLYGLTDGLGQIQIDSAGRIVLTGLASAGVRGVINNTNSTNSIGVTQSLGGVIEVNGNGGTGVHVLNNGSGDAVALVLGTVRMTGDGSYAAHMEINGLGPSALASGGIVTTTGSNSHALVLDISSGTNTRFHSLQLIGDGSVDTAGGTSDGLRVLAAGPAQVLVILQDNARVGTTGHASHDVDAFAVNAGGAVAVATGAATSIAVQGSESIGIQADAYGQAVADASGRISATGEHGIGIYTSSRTGNANVDVRAGASVMGGWQNDPDIQGSDLQLLSAGVVLSGATSTLNNFGTIGSAGDRAVLDDSSLPFAVPNGNLTLTNGGTITGFLQLAGAGTNTFTNNAAGVFEVRHFADTDGDGIGDTKRVARSDFGRGATSVLNNAGTVRLATVTGNAFEDSTGYYVPTTGIANTPLDPSFYRLARADVVQGQLTNLGTFRNSGTLDLRGPAVGNSLVITSNAAAGGAPGTGTFIADGGDLYMNAVLNDGVNSQADMLIVDRTQLGKEGPTRIHVGLDASSLGAQTPGNGIELVEVRDKTASAAGVFVLSGPVSSGAFDYQLFHNGVGADAADGNWYLRNFLALPGGSALPTYRVETPVYMAVPALTSRLGLAMIGNYHDRQGDDRVLTTEGMPSAAQRPAWGRLFGQSGETGSRAGTALRQTNSFQKYGPAYDYDLSGLQVGMDLNRIGLANGAVDTTGAYLGLGSIKGKVDAVLGGAAGSSKLESYSLGGYWSRKVGNGAYIDAVVQATYYTGQASSNRGQRIGTRGWGQAASLEGGLSHALGAGWAIEPQAQLTVQHLSLDDSQDQFARVDFNSNTAWVARLGARLTKSSVSDAGQPRLSWARFNVFHNLGSKATTTFSDLSGQNPVSLNTALGGVWGQLQVGHSAQLAANASAFVSLDYSFSLDSAKGHALGGRVGFKLVW